MFLMCIAEIMDSTFTIYPVAVSYSNKEGVDCLRTLSHISVFYVVLCGNLYISSLWNQMDMYPVGILFGSFE